MECNSVGGPYPLLSHWLELLLVIPAYEQLERAAVTSQRVWPECRVSCAIVQDWIGERKREGEREREKERERKREGERERGRETREKENRREK